MDVGKRARNRQFGIANPNSAVWSGLGIGFWKLGPIPREAPARVYASMENSELPFVCEGRDATSLTPDTAATSSSWAETGGPYRRLAFPAAGARICLRPSVSCLLPVSSRRGVRPRPPRSSSLTEASQILSKHAATFPPHRLLAVPKARRDHHVAARLKPPSDRKSTRLNSSHPV